MAMRSRSGSNKPEWPAYLVKTTCVPSRCVIETARLSLRLAALDDAPFILELLNEPGWLRYIGDKCVNSLEDARRYLRDGPLDMYERRGFGLYLVERKCDSAPIGLCGLIKRDSLEYVDIGFAFAASACGQGYAIEAAAGTLAYARVLGLQRLVAITTTDNYPSQKLLRKLGMQFERAVRLQDEVEALHLYSVDLAEVNKEADRANAC
jgi:[ribosomal protein S5]-alanine N-acetyltransferase